MRQQASTGPKGGRNYIFPANQTIDIEIQIKSFFDLSQNYCHVHILHLMNEKIENMKTIIFIITLMLFTNFSRAQYARHGNLKHTSDERIWVNLGAGGSSFGISTGLSGSAQFGHSIVSIRLLRNVEEDFSLFSSSSVKEKISDVGIMYGVCTRGDKAKASIAIGLSAVSYTVRGPLTSYSSSWFGPSNHEEIRGNTIGIPIEAQLFLTGKMAGFGICAFANINPQTNYFGALLCLQIGKLR